MTPGKDTRVAILHPPRPKERHEQALGVGFRCLYVSQEVHTRLWLSNAQHSLDLQMEGGLYVPCLQASAGATPHPTSQCTQEKSRKLNQGNQDGSLLPSYRRKGSCGEHFSSGCRGASHSSAATGQILSLLQGETLTFPLSGQKSWTTNKRFYLAAGYWPYKRTLP